MNPDTITRKEFYDELRLLEERSRAYTEKSHMDIADTVSRNIGAIQKSVAELKDTFQNHIKHENLRQQSLDSIVSKLEGVDFGVLKKSLGGYRDWSGFRNVIFFLGKVAVIITPIGAVLAWLFNAFDNI